MLVRCALLCGSALTATLSDAALGQSANGRTLVEVTLGQAKWDEGGPAAVIVPQGPAAVMILLRPGATTDELFAALAILDSRRVSSVSDAQGTRAIVVPQARVDPLPAALRARLSGYLRQLERAPDRVLQRFGTAKAITLRLWLKT